MTLTNATIIQDIQNALCGGYRDLQATLKRLRVLGVIESKLNLKWAELKVLAQQVINHLTECQMDDEIQTDKEANLAFKGIPATDRTPQARIWDKYRSHSNGLEVTMVYREDYNGTGVGYYLTFAADALKLERNTDLIKTYKVMGGVGVPVIALNKLKVARYRAELLTKGITLKLIG